MAVVDRSQPDSSRPRGLDLRTERALTALLAIDPATAAQVRDRSPSRRRPRPQHGPRLDLGGGPTGDGPRTGGDRPADEATDGSTDTGSDPR